MPLLLGYDIGSSSVKACILEAETGVVIASATSPNEELPITSPQNGWAEQDPSMWWEHVVKATGILKKKGTFQVSDIKAIGISYQMHGLVLVDENKEVLRPSIIWCDSRAIEMGKKAE
ncbi:MAG: carbohydrate kinase, partial [Fibrobacteria bacterium]|nr:carbohydrate kinase [Fibrobacteria bacterium]